MHIGYDAMLTRQTEQAPVSEVKSVPAVVMLASWKFLLLCVLLAALTVLALPMSLASPTLIAVEIAFTVLGLFLFGSFRYQIHKNALTYGAALVVVATYARWAWLHGHGPADGATLQQHLRQSLLTWHGLDRLIHIDTMLFILGLTVLVSALSQTRLLETLSLSLLRLFRGRVAPTLIGLCAVVAVLSGILDGVSMIGLLLRTLALILLLAGVDLTKTRKMMLVCAIVTTVCGMWMAYGEPPNLIMKANLLDTAGNPILTDSYFIAYCLPLAIVSFLIVAIYIGKLFSGVRVNMDKLDITERHSAEFRFLQAQQHGEMFSEIEVIEDHGALLGTAVEAVLARLRQGQSAGEAMIRAGVPQKQRCQILSVLSSVELAMPLDNYFAALIAEDADQAEAQGRALIAQIGRQTAPLAHARALGIGGVGVFVALLFAHAAWHTVPLFVAPFAGALLAYAGISAHAKIVRLAAYETLHEYAEYVFLIPLFLSISLLVSSGFFLHLQTALRQASQSSGGFTLALAQFLGSAGLSAILDNNVVADFTSRALHGLELNLIYLFSAAQIAGYATGGCLTHIGSAQSVVAFAFIRRDVDEKYSPVMWIREVGALLFTLTIALSATLWALSWLHRAT